MAFDPLFLLLDLAGQGHGIMAGMRRSEFCLFLFADLGRIEHRA